MTTDVKTLPYTNLEKLLKLLKALREKNNDDAEAQRMLGFNNSEMSRTKSALRSLGLIEESSSNFTQIGRELAFEVNEEKKKKLLLKVIKGFKPFDDVLNYIFQDDSLSKKTEIKTIISYWGLYGYGTTERNRRDAAIFLHQVIKYIGLGNVEFNPTRILWNNDASTIYKSDNVIREPQKNNISKEEESEDENRLRSFHKSIQITPMIEIHVDMTGWNDYQIKQFFKYAYGIFEDEQ